MIFPLRYGIISPEVSKGWSGDLAEGCRIIMNDAGIDSSKWQAGKTKLFLKEPSTVSFLDSQQEVVSFPLHEKANTEIKRVFFTGMNKGTGF